MENTAATTWPINELGELVFQAGVGTDKVVGEMPEGWVPTDPSTKKPILRLPSTVATAAADANGAYLGVTAPLGSGLGASRPVTIAGDCGASFNELCDHFGLDFATPTAITGVDPARATLGTATGTAILEFSAYLKSMRVTLPGETVGAWVPVKDGIFYLPSGSSSNKMRVSIIAKNLPTIDKTASIASGTRYNSRPNGSWKYQLSFVSNEQLKWTETQGIGGSQSTDIAGHLDQIINSGAKMQFMCASGNDVVTGNMTPAQSVAQTLANADQILAYGIPVVLLTIPPRWGKDASGGNLTFTGEYTAARQGAITTANRGYRAGTYSRPGLIPVGFSNCINPLDANGSIWNGWTGDGKHMAGGLAHGMATQIWDAISSMFSPYKTISNNVGAGDYFHATNNPGGNLLASNQGAFAGNGGAKNAGVTFTPAWITATAYAAKKYAINSGNLYYTEIGGTSGATAPTHTSGTVSDGTVAWTFICSGVVTGLGDNWSATCTGSVTAQVHTVTDQDGTRWQEFIMSGATADGDEVRVSPAPIGMTNIGATDLIAWEYDVKLFNPADCYGVFSDVQLTGGAAVVWDNKAMQSIQQGMRWDTGRVAVEPMVIPSGCTSIQPRTHIQSKANGSFRARYKNATVYKVL